MPERDQHGQRLKAALADGLSLAGDPAFVGVPAADYQKADPNALSSVVLSASGQEVSFHGYPDACRRFAKTLTSEAGEFGVELADDGLIFAAPAIGGMHVIHVAASEIDAIIGVIAPGSRISKAERRLLLQILSGRPMRDAAAEDKVSYETKRTHLKSLTAKLAVDSQLELSRKFFATAMARLFNIMARQEAREREATGHARAFLDFYYGGLLRLNEIQGTDRRRVRLVEAGPQSGRPVLFLHSQTLPPLSAIAGGWLETKGIRLVMPLRRGFLDPDAKRLAPADHVETHVAELRATIEHFGGAPVPVKANSTGVIYALALARKHAPLVDSVTIAAAAFIGDYQAQIVTRFVSGLRRLMVRSDFLTDQLLERYVARMSTPDGLRRMLTNAYRECARDIEIFSALLDSPLGHSWMYENYRLSRNSVAADIAAGVPQIWDGIGEMNVPFTFVHGALDPINSVSNARRISEAARHARFKELSGEGQSLFLSRLDTIVADF